MKYLVGDIGNTVTKITILDNKFKILKSYNSETIKLYSEKNLSIFFKKIIVSNLNKKILFSSVVPVIYKKIKKFLNKRNFKSYEIKELKVNKVIKLNVNNFKQVGLRKEYYRSSPNYEKEDALLFSKTVKRRWMLI